MQCAVMQISTHFCHSVLISLDWLHDASGDLDVSVKQRHRVVLGVALLLTSCDLSVFADGSLDAP